MKRIAAMTLILLGAATPSLLAQTPLNAVVAVDNGIANGGDARVRVAHLSPDAPNVDVLVDDVVAFGDVPFETVTDYASLPTGTYNAKVVPAGATTPVIIEADLDLEASTDYTVAATDILANITPLVLVDKNADPAAGNAHVRFVHGSPDAPAVDVVEASGVVLFDDTAFGESAGPTPVPAGTYDLEVRVAGTEAVALYLPGVTFEAGVVYTVYASGMLADGAVDRTLYLTDNRFRVELATQNGDAGAGRIVDIGKDDSGLFFFRNDDNIEMLVKVLDACTNFDHFWVFFSANTIRSSPFTVTDTATNQVREYSNPLGMPALPVQDTTAFATCP